MRLDCVWSYTVNLSFDMRALLSMGTKNNTYCSSSCRSSGFNLSRSAFAFRLVCVRGFSTIRNSSSSCETSKLACFNYAWNQTLSSLVGLKLTHIWYKRRFRVLGLQIFPIDIREPRVLLYVLHVLGPSLAAQAGANVAFYKLRLGQIVAPKVGHTMLTPLRADMHDGLASELSGSLRGSLRMDWVIRSALLPSNGRL